jgi:hypothetical protein
LRPWPLRTRGSDPKPRSGGKVRRKFAASTHQKTPEFLASDRDGFPAENRAEGVEEKALQTRAKRDSDARYRAQKQALPLSLTREEAAAYVGPIDGAGCRPVWIAIPQRPPEWISPWAWSVMTKGIIDFVYEQCSRKKMKEIKEIFFSKVPHMVETSLAHVTTVLERAYLQEKENPGDQAGEYLRLRPLLLQNNEVLDRPAVSDAVPLDNISPDMVTETQIHRLLHHELMASWTLDPKKWGSSWKTLQGPKRAPFSFPRVRDGNTSARSKKRASKDLRRQRTSDFQR